ncbi:hypothetical protein TWF718_004583 [Orbilia javanica]|uniref:Uncharacterized protein n=1 Tax=Orbilia javanica TaxID=47235 RepID=A0AAN8MSG1_9PEZI
MTMLKIVAILSASTLVVAPPPGQYSKYRPQSQSQSQSQSPNQRDSFSSGGTNSFRAPIIVPATPLTENPNPISANIPLNSDYSISQYSPSEGSREIKIELATVQFPSGGGGQNSGLLLSPVGTPRSARRLESRFPTRGQRQAGISPAPKKTRGIQWEDYENFVVDTPTEYERVTIPTTIQMLGMPSTARGPKPTFRDPVVMTPNWGSLAQGRGDGEDVEDDSGSSIDENYLDGLDDAPQTDQITSYRPGLTPRVQRAMASRGGQYKN